MLTLEQGKKLVKLARDSIQNYLDNKEFNISDDIKREFSKKQGIFVTLTINQELRGCIGFPEPMFPLYQAIFRAARLAAFDDSRFGSLTKQEFNDIEIEISVLTEPKELKCKKSELKDNIKIGEDGLIIEHPYGSGLLLPQVFTEYNVSAEDALNMTCQKAGLSSNCWQNKECKVKSFKAQIFSEVKGKIIEKN